MVTSSVISSGGRKRAAVQSVDRAVAVLQFLRRAGWSGVTEVAGEIGVHKSTAYRLLATLRDHGLVEQDAETERYRLGLGLVSLASAVTAEIDVARAARPVGQRLSERTQETVTITVLSGDEALIIDQATSPASVLSVDWTGRHSPLHCTSDGKVLLAHMPRGRQRRYLAQPLQRFTAQTIVDPEQLAAQLHAVQKAGYAYTVEEYEVGLNGVAAPIRTADGAVAAALSVSGPSFRLPVAAIAGIGALTVDAAAEISRRLGYHGARDRSGPSQGAST
jgi:DNA-binding IclR family transcriptional regulator